MKKILLLLFLLYSTSSFSQERVNKKLPQISQAPTSQITLSKGWRLQEDGQWISRNNRIPIKLDPKYKSLIDYEDYGLGTDNFTYMQFRKLTYEDQEYVLLIKKMKDGFYEYPSIKEGWINTFSYSYVIFDKEIFENKLLNIEDGKTNILEILPLKLKLVRHLNTSILTFISSDLSANGFKNENEIYNYQMFFQVSSYKEKGIVQFIIYDQTKTPNVTYWGYRFLSHLTNSDDINKIYYETTYENFKKFIRIP